MGEMRRSPRGSASSANTAWPRFEAAYNFPRRSPERHVTRSVLDNSPSVRLTWDGWSPVCFAICPGVCGLGTTAARTFSRWRLARTYESLPRTFGDSALDIFPEEATPAHDAAARSLPFPQPAGPRYVRRTGTKSDAIKCTRRTRSAIGTRPTTAARPANPRPTGPVAIASRIRTARRDNAAIRRGFELDQRRATLRPRWAASGAAIAVARTADVTRRSRDVGVAQTDGQGGRSPLSPRTAAAAPLRAR